jgi:hypothetical protein
MSKDRIDEYVERYQEVVDWVNAGNAGFPPALGHPIRFSDDEWDEVCERCRVISEEENRSE